MNHRVCHDRRPPWKFRRPASTQSAGWRHLLAAAALGLVFASSLDAASPTSGSAILLDNGEVLWGRVERLPGKLRILSPTGSSITLDRSRVRHVGATLMDLYEFQRDQRPHATPDEQLKIAAWCLEQKLFNESERHLQLALTSTSPPSGALQLQRRLSHLRELSRSGSSAPPETASTDAAPGSRSADSGFEAVQQSDAEVEKMEAELIRTFGAQVQPHLLRNCATAFCHGYGATNRFALVRPVADGPVEGTMTAQNLRRVIAQVRASHDGAEQFLHYSEAAHGTLSRPPLAGSDMAKRRLREFVVGLQRSPLASPTTVTARPVGVSLSFDPFDPAEFHRRQGQLSGSPPQEPSGAE